MNDKAIENTDDADVTDNMPVGSEQTVISDRENKMSSLVNNHNTITAGEGEHPEAAMTGDISDEETVDIDAGGEADSQELPDLPPGLKQNENGEWVQTLKVDGREIEQPYQTYHAQAQKYAAGDVRLQKSVEFQKQLDEQRTSLQEWEENLKTKEQRLSQTIESASKDTPQPGTLDDDSIEEEAGQIVKALFAGNEEDAQQALTTVLKSNRAAEVPIVDPQALAEQATNQALEQIEKRDHQREQDRQQAELGRAFNEFATEYSDIVNDPELYNMADIESDTVAREHPEWTPSQIMSEAGNRVRAQLPPKVDDPGEPDEPNQRIKNKANLQPIPAVRTTATQRPPATPEVDSSPEGVISQMRGSRRGLRNEIH